MGENTLLIVGAQLVDPVAGTTTAGDLHIAGETLTAQPKETAANVLDGSGLFAVPGLIDMHVHMASDPFGITASRWSEMTPTTQTLSAVDNLAAALAAGVTTVRDLGAKGMLAYWIRAAWQRGLFVGARPVVAGPVITSIGGHASWEGVESDGRHSIGALVRRNVANGSDVIKLMMGSAARSVELRADEVAEAVEEAHWHGVPVAVHANFSARSIDVAVASGCDTLEHGFAISAQTAALMAERDVALCPTTTALQSIVDDAPAWRRRTGAALVERAQQALPSARASFELAIAAGVKIVAGTDAGVTAVGFTSLPKELQTMVRWGMTPQQALVAATADAATALRRPCLGSLRDGASADVVLARSNPLVDIAAIVNPVGVVQQGRVVLLEDRTRLTGPDGLLPPGRILPGSPQHPQSEPA